MEIPYEIKYSTNYGKGIFSKSFIKSGTRVWHYKLNENIFEYNEANSRTYLDGLLTLADQKDFLDRTFGRGDVLCLITDDGQYMNHAPYPYSNCLTNLETGDCYAIKDINSDEQLFEDYINFSHPPFLYELLDKYQCKPTYYDLPNCS